MNVRVIPCLDVKDGRVVKGVNFEGVREVGDPVAFGKHYAQEGADELVFLSIAAAQEDWTRVLSLVKTLTSQISIPLTVGGGLATLGQVEEVFAAGAAKVSISSAAVKNPDLLTQVVKRFGGERLVLAVDAKRPAPAAAGWEVYINGGMTPTGLDLLTWVAQAEQIGVGEILLTSIDADGTQDGYDCEMLRAVSEHVKLPVIASGGAGKLEHFREAVQKGKAAAVLAASLFHFGTYSIREVKEDLAAAGIPVRLYNLNSGQVWL